MNPLTNDSQMKCQVLFSLKNNNKKKIKKWTVIDYKFAKHVSVNPEIIWAQLFKTNDIVS